MSKKIDLSNVKKQVLEKYNIVDVFRNDGIELIPESGNRYKCICPFHNEKTPSCKVSEDYQAYTCFGCGERGDVISYIQKTQQLSFPETVIYLAKEAKIEINDTETPEYNNDLSEGYRILKIAYEFYRKQFELLDDTHPAKKQILSRVLSTDDVIYGYAPETYTSLINHCKEKGISAEKLEMYSLAKKDKYDNYRDFFVNRLLFVFNNYMGKPIGFTGRKLSENDKAGKYINSSENPIFHKKQVFFNIDKAKKTAREKQELYVVEGQFDVIALKENGIENVVAASGTSFTEEHAKEVIKLISSNGRVIFCMDGDTAGFKSVYKIFRNHPILQDISYIIELPKDQDPCDYLQNNSQLPKEKLLLDYFYDKMKTKHNILNTTIEKTTFFADLSNKLLQYIGNNLIRDEYFHKGINWSYLNENEAINIYNQNITNKKLYKKNTENVVSTQENNKEYLNTILSFYLNNIRYLHYKQVEKPKELSNIIERLNKYYEKHQKIPSNFFDKKPELLNQVMSYSFEDDFTEEDVLSHYNHLMKVYNESIKKEEKEKTKSFLLNKLSECNNPEEKVQILKEYYNK